MTPLGLLVCQELRSAVRRPQFGVVAIVLVLIGPVSGLAILGSSALDHWMTYFTSMFDWVGLVYPLAVALLTQPRLLDEWSNTYVLSTRTRVSPGRYFAAKVITSALLAAGVFLVMTLVAFAAARLTYTDHGYGVPLVGPIEDRFPLSQLWGISPMLYVIGFSLWVAVVSAAVAVVCTLLSAVIGNRFVALAAPLILWFIANFGLAVLDWEELALPPFRFHIIQQPVWTEFAGLGLIVLVAAVLYGLVRRNGYLSAGIVHT